MNVFELTFFLLLLELTGFGSVWAYQSGGYQWAAVVPVGVMLLVLALGQLVRRRERRDVAQLETKLDDADPTSRSG